MKDKARPIILVKNLYHRYLPGTPLEVISLRDVNLKAYTNEVVGLIGPAGSGKSTLLQHLNGLLRPMEGEVLVDGFSLSEGSTDIQKIRKKIGLVFQNPEDQLFERYAGDDVAFGPRNMKLPHDEVRKKVYDAMEMVGLPFEYKDRLVQGMSQGERRRLALAGVLAMEPQVLVLDEPAANLDPEGRGELLKILKNWRSTGERSIVIASHNMDDIAELSDRVYVLSEGRIILEGYTKEVFSHYDLLINNGLSIPIPTEFAHKLRKIGYNVSPYVLTINEAVEEIKDLLYDKKK